MTELILPIALRPCSRAVLAALQAIGLDHMDRDDQLDSLARETRAALGEAGETDGGEAPRFELFHAANSICSQKVRVVLRHHALTYASREMSIFAGQTYLPSYVRLRMIGCRSAGAALAAVHRGSTAVASGGCDAAVVPTLIDWARRKVVVDSKAICLYIDATVPASTSLRPADLGAEIDAQLAIVDELPNYQMLMGHPPDGAATPVMRKGGGGPGFSLSKVERCERYLAEYGDDPVLGPAYAAKLAKERDAADRLFSPEAMIVAYEVAERACRSLDRRLAETGSSWLFGERETMADLFWGVELLRMKNLGADRFWRDGNFPALARYVAAVEALPAVRSAVLDWPGALF